MHSSCVELDGGLFILHQHHVQEDSGGELGGKSCNVGCLEILRVLVDIRVLEDSVTYHLIASIDKLRVTQQVIVESP